MNQKKIILYVKDWCLYCWCAKRLLKHKGYAFEVVDVTNDPEHRAWLAEASGQKTLPQVFIGERSVGGFDSIKTLNSSGELDRLVRDA